MCSRVTDELVVKVTTYDEAIDALVRIFNKKGNTKIDDQKKFINYVNRFLPEEQQNEEHIITAIYKSAANEYNKAKDQLEA